MTTDPKAAAFIERSCNTGQGVGEDEVELACAAAWRGVIPWKAAKAFAAEPDTTSTYVDAVKQFRGTIRAALEAALAARIPEASVEQAIARLWPDGFGPKNLDELVTFIEEERKCDAEYLAAAKAGRSSAEPVAGSQEVWTEWAGGECPVAFGAQVEVKLRDGTQFSDVAGLGGEYALNWEHGDPSEFDIVAYRLAPPAGRQEAVGVKALEWEGPDMHGEYYTRRNVGEQYIIRTKNGPWLTVVGKHYPTLEEAKAAAQADYETRIRSSLSPSGADLGGEVVRLTRKFNSAWESREFWRVAAEEENLARKTAEARLANAYERAARIAEMHDHRGDIAKAIRADANWEALSSITPAAGEDATDA